MCGLLQPSPWQLNCYVIAVILYNNTIADQLCSGPVLGFWANGEINMSIAVFCVIRFWARNGSGSL